MAAAEGGEAPDGVSQSAIDNARSMIAELFALMEIKRVVVVDDEWANAIDVEIVLAQISAIKAGDKSASLSQVKHFDGLKIEETSELWASALRERWAQLSNAARAEVWEQLQIDQQEANPSWTAFEQLVGSTDLRILSLEDWSKQNKELIDTARREPTLFLFDQNMEHSSGGAQDTGMRIIAT